MDHTTPEQTVIRAPQNVLETGVSSNLLADLLVKILFMQGEMSLHDLTRETGLSFAVVHELFDRLRKEQFVEVKGMVGLAYRSALTDRGRGRALELLSLNQYAGYAPVSLKEYTSRVRAQTVGKADVHPAQLLEAFSNLVVDARTLERLGAAAVSGTSILLYGPAGTGKTSIAEVLPSVYGDAVWIPHAVEVSGQIITVYDSALHQRLEQEMPHDSDGRWVLCRRPRVMVGGELTIEMLDLHFDPVGKLYSAPVQMKANNGVLIVDDFGRQLVRPEALLNRWIVPLDRGIDFLNLSGGKKFEIPFDLFVAFASNLEPAQLGDEAFLRRIPNKIKIDYLGCDLFHEIFRRVCPKFGLIYDAEVVDHIIDLLTRTYNEPLRSCQPRDLARQITWKARYQGYSPTFDRESASEACRNYYAYAAGALGDISGHQGDKTVARSREESAARGLEERNVAS
jgi:hypothetical protein